MSKRVRDIQCQINDTYDFKFEGLRLPKGAIYGKDGESPFACYDFRVKGRGFYKGLPKLRIWRFTGGKWQQCYETTPTTGRIFDLWEKVDPQVEWGDARHCKVRGRLGVVKFYKFKLYERPLPKGAIYGEDKDSIFFCYNYQVQGKNGYYQGYPRLEIWRPIVGGHESNNQTRWVKSVEANSTTAAILQLYFKLDLKVDWGNQAREIAKRAVNRPAKDEVHYKTFGKVYEKNASGRRIEIVVDESRTLDDIAAKQKGRPVYTGTL